MGVKFNPFTGNLDLIDTTAAAGADTQVQYNNGGSLAGSADLTWDDSAKELGVGGDINLDDGGTYETTVQVVTPTANRTISFPDATGTVALVAGSSGQLIWNSSGAQAGVTGSTVDGSGNVTLTSVSTGLGTAGAPTHSFTGDPNTGIYSPGADQVAISTNGTGRLFVNSDGSLSNSSSSDPVTYGENIFISAANYRGLTLNTTTASNRPTIAFRNTNGAGAIAYIQGDGKDLVFGRANSDYGGQSESLRITSDGNVGIGTGSPANYANFVTVALADTLGAEIDFIKGSTVQGAVYNAGDTFYIESKSTVPTAFVTNGSERLRIDSSGRLLVGTYSARSNFYPTTAARTPSTQIEYAGNQGFSVSRTDGSGALYIAKLNTTVDDESVGIIYFSGNDGTNLRTFAAISGEADGVVGTGNVPGRLVFSSTPSGSATPVERLRITSAGVLQIAEAGNIAVGTTTGTKIGTATTQKLGFYNATPVVQPAAVADATDAATVITQLNDLLAKLRTLGLIAT